MQISKIMGCNCGKSVPIKTNTQTSAPTINSGTNQILLKQIAEQNRQQAIIQNIINPKKPTIKTYR